MKPKKTDEPLVLGEPKFDCDGVELSVGDVVVRIPKQTALLFANFARMESAFDATEKPNEALSDIQEPELLFARVERILRHGGSLETAARLESMDPAKLRKFYGHAVRELSNMATARNEMARLAAGDRLTAYRLDGTGQRVHDRTHVVVARDLLQLWRIGLDDASIAERWKVDVNDLRKWQTDNKGLLDSLKQ